MKNSQNKEQGDDKNRSSEPGTLGWKEFCRHYLLWCVFLILLFCTWLYNPGYIIQIVCFIWCHIGEIAAALTILSVIIALNEYCEFYKKRLRFGRILYQCERISDSIALLFIKAKTEDEREKVYYKVYESIEKEINGEGKGIALLCDCCYKKKISKQISLDQEIGELENLRDKAKKDLQREADDIDNCCDKVLSAEEEEKKTKQSDLEKKCEKSINSMVDYLRKVNAAVFEIRVKILTDYHVRR